MVERALWCFRLVWLSDALQKNVLYIIFYVIIFVRTSMILEHEVSLTA